MATPVITFNNATGTDTAASGSASPASVLSGTSASYSGSVFTLDGSPDLSGVATDGTAVIWVQTSTGRQFFTINAVDDGADTVTVDDAPAGTTTGLTWGLGGKRKTVDNTQSRTLWTDAKYGWTAELEDDQTITSALTWSAPLLLQSNNDNIRTLDQSTGNTSICAGTSTVFLRNLKLTSSGTKGTNSAGVYQARFVAENCILGDATNTLYNAVYNSSGTMINCEVAHCTNYGIKLTSSACNLIGCSIHNNASIGVYLNSSKVTLFCCDIYDNGSYGFRCRASDTLSINSCNIHSNDADGIACNVVGAAGSTISIVNSNVTDNTGYGVLFQSGQDVLFRGLIANNNFGTGATANSSGRSSDDTILDIVGRNIAVDPQFTDAANGDFNSTGSNTSQLGYPLGVYGQGLSESYLDIGNQREPTAAGGGGLLRVNMNGNVFG